MLQSLNLRESLERCEGTCRLTLRAPNVWLKRAPEAPVVVRERQERLENSVRRTVLEKVLHATPVQQTTVGLDELDSCCNIHTHAIERNFNTSRGLP